jgi:hypothetical protein
MAALGPVNALTMRHCPGRLGLPARPGFDFNANMIEPTLDKRS